MSPERLAEGSVLVRSGHLPRRQPKATRHAKRLLMLSLRPRLAGIVEGLVVAVIVWAATQLAALYKSGLDTEHKAHLRLGPVESALVALPPWAVLSVSAVMAFLLALCAIWLLHWLGRETPNLQSVSQPPPPVSLVPEQLLVSANREARDAGTADRIAALEQQRDKAIAEREEARKLLGFPDFQVSILEIVACDPVTDGNLYAAIFVQIANSGSPSVARAFEVEAHTVFGSNIRIDISCPDEYTIYLNRGTAFLQYLPEHYLMTRTYDKPIVRGNPVTGVVPCIFRSITSLKEVDMRSLKVRICDGTGTADKESRYWESVPLTGGMNFAETVEPRVRIGFPVLQQRTDDNA